MPNSKLLQLMGLPPDQDDISYDICLDLSRASWDEVSGRIATHPNEVKEEDCLHGNSPLEIILKSKSIEEIPLEVYSKILEKEEVEGGKGNVLNEGIFIYIVRKRYSRDYMKELVSLVLDKIKGLKARSLIEVAIWYCNVPAAEVILERYPTCVKERDRIKAQLPLHIACEENNENESERLALIEMILEAGVKNNVGGWFGAGGLYIRDYKGNTPLMLILQSMNNPFAWNSKLFTLCTRVAFEDCKSQMLGEEEVSHDLCDQVLDTSFHFPILHEAMNISSPDAFYQIIEIVNQFDIELAGTDRRGRTALIKAIYLDKEEQLKSYGANEANHTRKSSTKEIIGMIVGAVQSNCASIRDGAGRLPLHIAAEMGLKWSEGIREIVFANRNGLKERHCVTGLYSFMVAASNPTPDLDTIFCLMRERPKIFVALTEGKREHEKTLVGSIFSFRKPVHGPIIPNLTWDSGPHSPSGSTETKSTANSIDSAVAELIEDPGIEYALHQIVDKH